MHLLGQKTILGSLYNWDLAPAVQLLTSLPDYSTAS